MHIATTGARLSGSEPLMDTQTRQTPWSSVEATVRFLVGITWEFFKIRM